MTDHDDKKPAAAHTAPGKPLGQPHQDDEARRRAAGLPSPAMRGALPGDRQAEHKPEAEAHQGEHVSTFSPEQLATPAPQMDGSRQMYIIVGPYKGSVLTMPDAEAEDAKDSHWAVEMDTVAPPFDADKPPEHDHELTEEDRAYAVEAANAWAAKVNEPELPPDPPADEPAPEGETDAAREAREKRNADRRADYDRRKADHDKRNTERDRRHNERQMKPRPDGTGGGYETRRAPDKSRR